MGRARPIPELLKGTSRGLVAGEERSATLTELSNAKRPRDLAVGWMRLLDLDAESDKRERILARSSPTRSTTGEEWVGVRSAT